MEDISKKAAQIKELDKTLGIFRFKGNRKHTENKRPRTVHKSIRNDKWAEKLGAQMLRISTHLNILPLLLYHDIIEIFKIFEEN